MHAEVDSAVRRSRRRDDRAGRARRGGLTGRELGPLSDRCLRRVDGAAEIFPSAAITFEKNAREARGRLPRGGVTGLKRSRSPAAPETRAKWDADGRRAPTRRAKF